MLRRCVLEFSSIAKTRRLLRTQKTPFWGSSRRGFSNGVKTPQETQSAGQKNASTGSLIPKILLGAIVVGAAVVVADETGYLDVGLRQSKIQTNGNDVQSVKDGGNVLVIPDVEPSVVASHYIEENINKIDDAQHIEDTELTKTHVSEVPSHEEPLNKEPLHEDPLHEESLHEESLHEESLHEESLHEESLHEESLHEESLRSIERGTQETSVQSDLLKEDTQLFDNEKTSEDIMQLKASSKKNIVGTPSETEIKLSPIDERVDEPKEVPKVSLVQETDAPSSLLGSYSLQDEIPPEITSRKEPTLHSMHISPENKALDLMSMESTDDDNPENIKIVLDVIQAIHIAEKRQAESDFHVFQEEKRRLKEKYEKELIDARFRELKLAGEADTLDKELNDEREKSVAALKMLQDKAEQNLKIELQNKEEEMQNCIKKTKEMAKAELNSVVAQEKASQLEKIAEANLHVNALCMAFYARSEEARQTHSVYKLALGALALEDALMKGFPVQTEVDMLRASLADIKNDTLVDLVLSSLPEETLNNGTDTKLQLNQKFDALKGTLRHFSFIPHGGGGILTHVLSYIASSIKVRENASSEEGIESTISRVDMLLAEGKLSEAATTLESAVSGTEAEGAVQNWVKQARNRAIAEQALAVLQSYATSMSLN